MKAKICPSCRGEGIHLVDVGTHNTEYEEHTCEICNGTGKVIVRKFKYEVPFGSSVSLISNAEKKIFETITKLEKDCQKKKK